MDKINEGVTYVFGENAAIDGEVNSEWVVDFFYFKDSPLWNDFFKALRDTFWNILRPLISMLNS